MGVHRGLRYPQRLLAARLIPRPLTSLLTTPYHAEVSSQLVSKRSSSVAQSTLSSSQSTANHFSSPPKSRPIPYKALIYGTTAVFVGLMAGNTVRLYLAPPPLPTPSTQEDIMASEKLRDAAAALPIVKDLRLHPKEWVEISADDLIPENEKAASFTAGSMRGSRGLAVNTVFWNRHEKRTISVVHFGGALTGWPGVTHGGAIATVMLENLERLASSLNSGSARSSQGFVETMELQYRAPTFAKAFYIIRTEVDESPVSTAEGNSKTLRARLESAEKGTLCVEATAQCRPYNQAIGQQGQMTDARPGGLLESCYKALKNLLM